MVKLGRLCLLFVGRNVECVMSECLDFFLVRRGRFSNVAYLILPEPEAESSVNFTTITLLDQASRETYCLE